MKQYKNSKYKKEESTILLTYCKALIMWKNYKKIQSNGLVVMSRLNFKKILTSSKESMKSSVRKKNKLINLLRNLTNKLEHNFYRMNNLGLIITSLSKIVKMFTKLCVRQIAANHL